MTTPLPRIDRRRLLGGAAGLAGLAALPGCGALAALGGATEVLDAYELRPPQTGPVATGTVARSLIVETPSAAGAIDTDRILIRPHPLQAQYLPRARWTETAPVMVQTLLLRTLEDAGGLRFVGRRPLAGAGDFALVSELTAFQADVPGAPEGAAAAVSVRLLARLVREADAAVLSTRAFSAAAPVPRLETLAVVEAFDIALSQVLAETARWALSGVGVRLAAPSG